jgi:hypothetical protein
LHSGEIPTGHADRGIRGTAATHVSDASPMNDSVLRVAVCAECRLMAEPPLTRLYDPYGLPTKHFICLDCQKQILHPDELRGLGGEDA